MIDLNAGEAGQKGRSALAVNLGGMALANPVLTASGTFGYGLEYSSLVDLSRLGAVIIKGTTLQARPGNPPPRISETPAGMLNAIGLENPGIDAVVADILPRLIPYRVPVLVNIAGNTVEEYAALAARLDGVLPVVGLEVNISCPNVKEGGLAFGHHPAAAARVTAAVRKATDLPIMVKLSPNAGDIVAVAQAVAEAGADALSMINTLLGMAIDVERKRPVLANTFGGLSGPAVKPVALRVVWQVYEAVSLPILGTGGIMKTGDALEFILAGATAVAVGTGNFVDPATTVNIIDGLTDYCRKHETGVNELVGAAHRC